MKHLSSQLLNEKKCVLSKQERVSISYFLIELALSRELHRCENYFLYFLIQRISILEQQLGKLPV